MNTYYVTWSAEDGEYVATCPEYPSLSWLAADEVEALDGLVRLIAVEEHSLLCQEMGENP